MIEGRNENENEKRNKEMKKEMEERTSVGRFWFLRYVMRT